MSHFKLDATKLLCPLPVIKTQNTVKNLVKNDTLEITGTDPGIMQDIPMWCRLNGHEVLTTVQEGFEYIITIKVC